MVISLWRRRKAQAGSVEDRGAGLTTDQVALQAAPRCREARGWVGREECTLQDEARCAQHSSHPTKSSLPPPAPRASIPAAASSPTYPKAADVAQIITLIFQQLYGGGCWRRRCLPAAPPPAGADIVGACCQQLQALQVAT